MDKKVEKMRIQNGTRFEIYRVVSNNTQLEENGLSCYVKSDKSAELARNHARTTTQH